MNRLLPIICVLIVPGVSNAQSQFEFEDVASVGDTDYATFGIGNQNIVWNSNGVFVTFLSYWNNKYPKEGGKRHTVWDLYKRQTPNLRDPNAWTRVYQSVGTSKPPAIETDFENNLFLFSAGNQNSGTGILYKFSPPYKQSPETAILENGWADKFCMASDPNEKRLYLFNSHIVAKQFWIADVRCNILNNGGISIIQEEQINPRR